LRYGLLGVVPLPLVVPLVVPPVVPEPVVVVVVCPFVVEFVAERWFHGCQTKSPMAKSTTTMTATRIGVVLPEELAESRSTML
jgi:hypothetical protein